MNQLIKAFSFRVLLVVSYSALTASVACSLEDTTEYHYGPQGSKQVSVSVEEVAVTQLTDVLVPPVGQAAEVVRVIDGDTIEVELGGKLAVVRYIGVDTPETKHPGRGIECFGPEASKYNEQMVGGREVILEKDITDRDRYGRLLRYVWVEDKVLINSLLVSKGYARVSIFEPDMKYQEQLLLAQVDAQSKKSGIWGVCGQENIIIRDSFSTNRVSNQDLSCSLNYPEICLPKFPPDLDCSDVSVKGFLVLSPDPHKFDGDGDGIGCEG